MIKNSSPLKLAFAFSLFALTAITGSARAALDSDLLSGLKARAIGPAAIGGRIAAIDAVHSDPNHIVIGVATGGVAAYFWYKEIKGTKREGGLRGATRTQSSTKRLIAVPVIGEDFVGGAAALRF